MPHVDMGVETQLDLPSDVFQVRLALIVQVEKEHEGTRNINDGLVFQHGQETFS
jgi:hypothetical protein